MSDSHEYSIRSAPEKLIHFSSSLFHLSSVEICIKHTPASITTINQWGPNTSQWQHQLLHSITDRSTVRSPHPIHHRTQQCHSQPTAESCSISSDKRNSCLFTFEIHSLRLLGIQLNPTRLCRNSAPRKPSRSIFETFAPSHGMGTRTKAGKGPRHDTTLLFRRKIVKPCSAVAAVSWLFVWFGRLCVCARPDWNVLISGIAQIYPKAYFTFCRMNEMNSDSLESSVMCMPSPSIVQELRVSEGPWCFL